jgi:hypothetical protein
MKTIDGIINAMSELLIENQVMRELILEMDPDLLLEVILAKMKSNAKRRRRVEACLAPLRTAMQDEADIEDMMREIMKRAVTDKTN